MLVNKGYKYRLYPTVEQALYLSRAMGCARKVYNLLLAQSIEQYNAHKASPESTPKPDVRGYSLVNAIPSLKAIPEYAYLKEAPAHALQASALSLGQAYTNFFRKLKTSKGKPGFPRFKSRHHGGSFKLTKDDFSAKDGQLQLPKIDSTIKVKWSRQLPANPSSVTIARTPSGKYYVCFTCEVPPTLTNGTGIVGLDFGITNLIVTSDGEQIPGPKSSAKYSRCLKRAQQALSRKVKGSKNRAKARLRVAAVHERIAQARKDYAEQVSRRLVNENKVLVIEELRVANMMKNHRLARSLQDASFGMLAKAITRKAMESCWASLVVADTFFPSTQLCSVCHTKALVKVELGVKKWTCHCGAEHDRDVNASLNLKHLGEVALEAYDLKGGSITKVDYDSYKELLAQ